MVRSAIEDEIDRLKRRAVEWIDAVVAPRIKNKRHSTCTLTVQTFGECAFTIGLAADDRSRHRWDDG